MNRIDLDQLGRFKVGYIYLEKILEYTSDTKIKIVYDQETKELIDTDESLSQILKKLEIPYEYRRPNNSVLYLKQVE
jgi:hypothetical protein